MRRGVQFHLGLVAILLAAALLRLPQFFGENMIPDGDEAILGLMGKHMSEGHTFPWFFYGQSYGFSFFEAGLTAIFFKVWGVQTAAMKAAMLLLWLIGLFFLAMAVRELSGERAGWIAAILLGSAPAWAAWSMKARGGYLTAFVLFNLTVWILARIEKRGGKAHRLFFAAGLCGGVILFAQVIWLIALVPFVATLLDRRRKPEDYFAIGAGALASALPILWVSLRQPAPVWAPALFDQSSPLRAALLLPYRIFVAFSGSYYLDLVIDMGFATHVAGGLWLVAFTFSLAFALRSSREPAGWKGITIVASLVCILIFSLIVGPHVFGFRYLLPLTGILVIPLASGLARNLEGRSTKAAMAGSSLAILVLAGCGAMWEFRGVAFEGPDHPDVPSESRALSELLDELQRAGVHEAYALDPLLQWRITFASDEKIAARWVAPRERYPVYAQRVDEALMEGKPVALIGEAQGQAALRPHLVALGLPAEALHEVEHRYAYVLNPTRKKLEQIGFLFDP